MFGNKVYSSTNIDEAVALGAALYAAYKGDRTNLTPIQKSAVEKIKVGEKTSKYFGTIALLDDPSTGGKKISNSIILDKNMEIPCSVEQSYYTISDDQTGVDCTVTESSSREKNPKFVKKVWEGSLELPSGRPKGQEIKVTFSYDDNQIMHCSFIDVGSKKKKEIDLTIKSAEEIESGIDKFTVE
jgi:molecular chaperone DnaK